MLQLVFPLLEVLWLTAILEAKGDTAGALEKLAEVEAAIFTFPESSQREAGVAGLFGLAVAILFRGLLAQMASVFAELERAMIRERTRSAMSVKRKRGERISGHAPYGWDFGTKGRLVENAGEQRIIARARGRAGQLPRPG